MCLSLVKSHSTNATYVVYAVHDWESTFCLSLSWRTENLFFNFKVHLLVILQHRVAQQNASCIPFMPHKKELLFFVEVRRMLRLRSLTAWGKKLLWCLVERQRILLWRLPDGSRVNRLLLWWVLSFNILWALRRHLTSLMLGRWNG